MNLTLRYAAHSHRGLVREVNQDSVYAGPRLLAVADGMGGMAAGDVASTIVIKAVAPLDEDVPGDDLVDALRANVAVANQRLRDMVSANARMEGMGTTLTAMLFSGSKMALGHVGDSRAYLLRDGQLTQITRDDTYVQMLVDEAKISEAEAGSHPQRSLLTKALDGRDVSPDYRVRPVEPGDRYLICSDGLSGVVSEDTIADTMREYVEPQPCVERLVGLALRGGGPDNITVIVADATDEDIMEATPVVGGAAADRGAAPEPVPVATAGDESTPAARASALAPPPRDPDGPAPGGSEPGEPAPDLPAARPDRARRPVRTVVRTTVLLAVLLGLLGGGLWYGWSVTQSGYYLGEADDGTVAVFRGLPGRVAGLDLSRVHRGTGCAVADLGEDTQDRIRRGGIRYSDPDEAEREMIDLIRRELAEPAGPSTPTPTPTPTARPSEDRRPDFPIRPEPTPEPGPVADPADCLDR